MDDRLQAPLNNNKPIIAFKTTSGEFQQAGTTDLNEVWKDSLKQQSANRKTLSIHRSDKLPFVHGNKESLVRLFDFIAFMILNHPPQNSKLFLYVKCEADEVYDPEVLDLRARGDERMYRLSFYTNITTDEQWEQLYKDQLTFCAVIAKENKGSFSFHPISNTGCLFSLTLPGKNS